MSSSRLRSSTRASTAASEFLAETETKPKGESRSKPAAQRQPTKSELVRLTRIAFLAYFTSWAIIVSVIYFSLNDTIKLYPNTIRSDSLKGFNARAEYSLRYQTLLYFWLVINTYIVIYHRLTKKALNPLVDSTEKYVQQHKNILTNSFEQIAISSFLQLGFASFADPILVLKLIPALNFVQFFGRIAFFFGYPLYRTLGVGLTLSPNLLLLGYNLFKFGVYLGLY